MSLDAYYARALDALGRAKEQIRATIPDDPFARVLRCPACNAACSVMRGRHTGTVWVWHPESTGVDPCRHGGRNFPKRATWELAVAVFEQEVKL